MTLQLELQPGQTIDGKYEVVEKLGIGGFGIVYKAFASILQRHVAIKVLKQPVPQDDERWRRLQREAQICSTLSNEHIVKVFSLGLLPDNRPYLVMDYVEGRDLSSLGRLPWEKVVEISLQVLDGLGHAHANGVIHRDLKPSNILLHKCDDKAKILDFGLAKSLYSEKLTVTGMTQGTADYMSPEQVCGQKVDGRSDLYSWGCVMYELLTGEKPFGRGTNQEIMMHQLSTPLKRNADLPAALQEVIGIATAKKPGGRYDCAASFADALKGVLSSPRKTHLSRWQRLTGMRRFPAGTGKLPQKVFVWSSIVFLVVGLAMFLLLRSDHIIKAVLPALFVGQSSCNQYASAAAWSKRFGRNLLASSFYKSAAEIAPNKPEQCELLLKSADCSNYSASSYTDIWNSLVYDVKANVDDSGPLDVLMQPRWKRYLDLAMYVHNKVPAHLRPLCIKKGWMAELMMGAERYRDAAELSAESIGESPSFETYVCLGEAYTRLLLLGEDDAQRAMFEAKAEYAFDNAMRLKPASQNGYVVFGQYLLLLARCGDIADTHRIKFYEKSIRVQQKSLAEEGNAVAGVHASLGRTYMELANLEPDIEKFNLMSTATSQFTAALTAPASLAQSDPRMHDASAEYHECLAECYWSQDSSLEAESERAELLKQKVLDQWMMAIKEHLLAIERTGRGVDAERYQRLADDYVRTCDNWLLSDSAKMEFYVKALDAYSKAMPSDPAKDEGSLNVAIVLHYHMARCYMGERALAINWAPNRQEQLYKKCADEFLQIFKLKEKRLAWISPSKAKVEVDAAMADYCFDVAQLAGIGTTSDQRIDCAEKGLKYEQQKLQDGGQPDYLKIGDEYLSTISALESMPPSVKRTYRESAIRAYRQGLQLKPDSPKRDSVLHRKLALSYLSLSDVSPDAASRTYCCQNAIGECQQALSSSFTTNADRSALHQLLSWSYVRLGVLERDPNKFREMQENAIDEQRLSVQFQGFTEDAEIDKQVALRFLHHLDSQNLIRFSTPESRRCYKLAIDLLTKLRSNTKSREESTALTVLIAEGFSRTSILPDLSRAEEISYIKGALDQYRQALNSDATGKSSCLINALIANAYTKLGNAEEQTALRRASYRSAMKYNDIALRYAAGKNQNHMEWPLPALDASYENRIPCLQQRTECAMRLADLEGTPRSQRQSLYHGIIADEEQIRNHCRKMMVDPHVRHRCNQGLLAQLWAGTYTSIGNCYIALGNTETDCSLRGKMYDDAINEIEQALKSDLGFWNWSAPLGLCYLARGDKTEGRRYIEQGRLGLYGTADLGPSYMQRYEYFLFANALYLKDLDEPTSAALKAEYDKFVAKTHLPAHERQVQREFRLSTTPIKTIAANFKS